MLQLFLAFLRLGATAFGGPPVHIAMMEREFVERRKWLTLARFRELLGAAGLIPGPTSTELALLIGQERAGLAGLLAAGFGFILPAFAAVLALAIFVESHGITPEFARIMAGVKPVLIAIIFQALIQLFHTVFHTRFQYVCALAALVAGFFDVNILIILFGAGALNAICQRLTGPRSAPPAAAALGVIFAAREKRLTAAEAAGTIAVGAAALPSAWGVLAIFLKMGAFFYGSGYVLLAFLREDFVVRLKLLTEQDLLTAITVGNLTPGPLFTAATFVGYKLRGIPGAVAATVGIFAPAFVYAALSGLFVPCLRKSPAVADILDGVNAAAWAVMALVLWQLQRDALIDWRTALIALVSLALLFRFKLNGTWLVLAGALCGYLFL